MVNVQYEAQANQSVQIPDLLSAYQRGKEMRYREESLRQSTRSQQLANQRNEMELPYVEQGLKTQQSLNDQLIKTHGIDYLNKATDYLYKFLPLTNSVQDLAKVVKGAEEYLNLDQSIVDGFMGTIPDEVMNDPAAYQKWRDNTLDQITGYGVKARLAELEFSQKKQLGEMDQKYRTELESMRNRNELNQEALRYGHDINAINARIRGEREIRSMAPQEDVATLNALYEERDKNPQGSDKWNSFNERIKFFERGYAPSSDVRTIEALRNIPQGEERNLLVDILKKRGTFSQNTRRSTIGQLMFERDNILSSNPNSQDVATINALIEAEVNKAKSSGQRDKSTIAQYIQELGELPQDSPYRDIYETIIEDTGNGKLSPLGKLVKERRDIAKINPNDPELSVYDKKINKEINSGQTSVSDIGKYIYERNSLDANDPNRKIYDDIIKKKTAMTSPQASLSPLGKLYQDRDNAILKYGENSPEVRNFNEKISEEKRVYTPSVTETRKLIQDRDWAITAYGADSPEVKAFQDRIERNKTFADKGLSEQQKSAIILEYNKTYKETQGFEGEDEDGNFVFVRNKNALPMQYWSKLMANIDIGNEVWPLPKNLKLIQDVALNKRKIDDEDVIKEYLSFTDAEKDEMKKAGIAVGLEIK